MIIFKKNEIVKYKKRKVTLQHSEKHEKYGVFWYVKEMMCAIRESDLQKFKK